MTGMRGAAGFIAPVQNRPQPHAGVTRIAYSLGKLSPLRALMSACDSHTRVPALVVARPACARLVSQSSEDSGAPVPDRWREEMEGLARLEGARRKKSEAKGQESPEAGPRRCRGSLRCRTAGTRGQCLLWAGEGLQVGRLHVCHHLYGEVTVAITVSVHAEPVSSPGLVCFHLFSPWLSRSQGRASHLKIFPYKMSVEKWSFHKNIKPGQ